MTNQFDSECKEGEPIFYIDIDPHKLGEDVDTGIKRASNFSKFIQATKIEKNQIESLNQHNLTSSNTSWSDKEFIVWNQGYKIWGFNNCLTEIIEVFFYFLENAWNIREISKNPKRIKRGQRIPEIFTDLSFQKNLEQWFKSGVSIAENEKEILSSLIELRHLITHNASIVQSRKQLKENSRSIIVKWYNIKPILIGESGKKLPFERHTKENGSVGIIPKSTVKREFEIGKMLELSYKDIQEIIYTLQWIMLSFKKQVLNILEGKDPKEDPFEMKIDCNFISY